MSREYFAEYEEEGIEKETEERYKYELGNFKNCFDPIFMSRCFEKMKIQRRNSF
jgi:hypothetical protein